MPPAARPTRRLFLGTAAALAVPAVPAVSRAGDRADGLGVGVLGCGARGTQLALELVKLGHSVVAVCDIAEFRTAALAAALAKADPDGPPPDTFADYKKLLDVKAVEAVVIATPDHHHKEHLVAAVSAEKDVYVETPLTKSLDEGPEMADAVRKANRVVQVGTQRRSGPHWEEVVRAVRNRAFGKLVRVRAWDATNWQGRDPTGPPPGFKPDPKKLDWDQFLGTAPRRPFDAHRYFAWRWYWDYAGGLLPDRGGHLLDLFAWAGGVEVPKSAVANGGRYLFDKWETPDLVTGVWDYAKFAATFSADAVNGSDGAGVTFHGTRQTVVADADGFRLYDTADRVTPAMKPQRAWAAEPETPAHLRNWIDCVRSRDEPAAPVGPAARAMVGAHLATLSYRTGKKVFWDADRGEVIGGS